MSDYAFWRDFAGTWGLIYFSVFFFVAVGYALWPSRRKSLEEAAQIPLDEE